MSTSSDVGREAAVTTTGLPARQIADLVRRRVVTATDVVSEHLRRVAALNTDLNAFTAVVDDQALAAARAVDDALSAGEEVPPLAGVPFSVKDVIAVSGLPLQAGSPAMAGVRAEQDATAVARLRTAGAICLGKTNTPEFALSTQTWSPTHGYTINPIAPHQRLSPGGSSGGESAAVASGMSAFGMGTDFGGSVRWPAHCTGIASLRPGVGRVPADGQLPGLVPGQHPELDADSAQGQLQVVGPIARTIADVRLLSEVLLGESLGTPDVSGLRVGWCDDEGTMPVDARIRAAVAQAASSLADRVASVVHDRPETLTAADPLFSELRATDQQDGIRALAAPEEFGPVVRQLLASVRPVSREHVERLWGRVRELRDTFLAQMADVLILPVSSVAAPATEAWEVDVEGQTLDGWQIVSACRAVTLLGLPAAVATVGALPDERPIGVQVVARPGREDVALAVAELLENSALNGTEVHS
ncbi:amidase [Halopolyspora algeriensis]|nr:amidase [Halopolyspora algeriensis]